MDFDQSNRMPTVSGRARPLRRARMLLLALGVVAASSVGAHARDLCLTFSGGGGLALKGFRVPGVNKCAPIQGIELGNGRSVVAGTACTNSNQVMSLHYTAHAGSVYYFETARCFLYLPIAPTGSGGGCNGQYVTPSGGDGFSQSMTASYCNVDVPL
jgi:hypothetical protein